VLWDYLWPPALAAIAIGVVAGTFGFRRYRLKAALGIGVAAALAAAIVWHGPLAAGERLSRQIEADAATTLEFYEMTGVTARVHRAPLSRQLILSGPADDFQRVELVRTLSAMPGVSVARWSPDREGLPLVGEGALAALVGFLIGLLLAYLLELHRRYNAQWKW
jgi:hypothetical protein